MTRLFLLFVFTCALTLFAGPVDDMAPGTWYEAPNTHMRDVDPCPQRNCSYSGTGGQAAIIKAWGGAAYDDTRDRLIVWGGGHGDYGGNEVYVFDVNTLTWTRVTDPSDPPARDEPYASDGAPGSSHSRNTLQYVPHLDALCIFGFSGYFPSAGTGSRNTDCYDFTNDRWIYQADAPVGGSGRGITGVDKNGMVWSHGDGQQGKLCRYNPYTDTWNEFVKNPAPRYPMDGVSYEAYDPNADAPLDGVFVAGWSREASSGLVSVARKDGETGAKAVLQYLSSQDAVDDCELIIAALSRHLEASGKRVIDKSDIKRLTAVEQAEAERRKLEEYKMKTNEEMLAAIDQQ